MADWLKDLPEAAQASLQGRKLDEVECLVSDLSGVARGKAMPASKFARQSHFYLPNSIFLQTITGDWVENEGESWTEPDMILKPDLSTATAAPWTGDWTLQVIHDIEDQAGNPMPVAPRNVLKRVIQLYADQGWTPIATCRRTGDGVLPRRAQHRSEPAGGAAHGPLGPPRRRAPGLFDVRRGRIRPRDRRHL